MKKVALIILDGFGTGGKSAETNAILRSKTPVFKRLFSESSTALGASGLAVWVPEGQMGNSEIGHMTIGGGRIFAQSIVLVNEMLETGKFQNHPWFQEALARAKTNGRIHFLGLLGPWGVHAHTDHLVGMIRLVPSDVRIELHLFADGRDTDRKSFLEYLESLYRDVGPDRMNVASVCWRYYAMDRDTNWERTERAFRVIMGTENAMETEPLEWVRDQYENGITDEFFPPTRFSGSEPIGEGDAVVFCNFRSDRAKQLTRAFTDAGFDGFPRNVPKNLLFATMTRYYPEFSGTVFFEDTKRDDFLWEVLARNRIPQFHLAETEKFSHVTKFFNGGRDEPFEGEIDLLVPSHKVATYDADPAMSAAEILEAFVAKESEYPFVVVNFANGDMVGHTGNMAAAVKAVETLDSTLDSLIRYCQATDRDLLITADHGNIEDMGTTDAPMTAHTCNPVPFWHVRDGKTLPTRLSWGLADIAPTVLELMGIQKPEAMTGTSLIPGP